MPPEILPEKSVKRSYLTLVIVLISIVCGFSVWYFLINENIVIVPVKDTNFQSNVIQENRVKLIQEAVQLIPQSTVITDEEKQKAINGIPKSTITTSDDKRKAIQAIPTSTL